MLLDFSVRNFSAIGEKQRLSMLTGKARGKAHHTLKAGSQRALKLLSIYGANAAGKSTVIRAMNFSRNTILKDNGSLDKRFFSVNRSDDMWKEEATEFIYTLYLNKKTYEYGFVSMWKDETIVKEWLFERNSKQESKLIFIRDFISRDFKLNIKPKKFDVSYRLTVYFDDARNEKNLLFLKAINSQKGDIFESDSSFQYLRLIYRWFLIKLRFVYPHGSELGNYSFYNYSDNHDELCYRLTGLGIPISKISEVEIPIEMVFKDAPHAVMMEIDAGLKSFYQQQDIRDEDTVALTLRLGDDYYTVEVNAEGIQKIKTITFTHGKFGTYEFREQSDGTRRVLELLEMIISPERDITYVVDEIDRSLHPLLTEKLISMYLNAEEPNQSQLIFSTHESRLLNLKVLRKDEVYFAASKDGQSMFERLDEYEHDNPRTDLNLELAYLSGRYTGIPNIVNVTGI